MDKKRKDFCFVEVEDVLVAVKSKEKNVSF